MIDDVEEGWCGRGIMRKRDDVEGEWWMMWKRDGG